MKKQAFSLVELIVGITISMILMMGIGVFVGGWISNLTLQEKVLDNNEDFWNFSRELQNVFSRLDTSISPISTSSWYIFRQYKEFDKWGFVYIWKDNIDLWYCESDAEQTTTNHVFIKNFIPFEEQDENIFTDPLAILTATAWWYISYQKEHVIKDSIGNLVVWKWVFWDKFTEWGNWTDIYLNNPTGLASSWNILFISDTLNNRILAYDTSSKKIYKLLDEKDGLNEPTGLYFDSTEKSLYIANSWAWEILKYSSRSESTNPTLNLSFSWVTASITNFKVEFFTNSWNPSLSWPTSTWNFSFSSNLTDDTDYLTGSTNNLRYYFANYTNSSSDWPRNLWTCTPWVSYYLNWTWDPEKQEITCDTSSTWTIITSNWNVTQSLTSTTIYSIDISNITPNFTWIGTYYTKLSLYNWSTLQHEQYFPYFVQGDDNLLTSWDNTLEIVTSWLDYPTGIWWPTNYNQFPDGRSWNLSFDSKNDYKLKTPILSLNLDFSADLLNLDLKYYKQFNCYNADDKIERNFMLKKSFR